MKLFYKFFIIFVVITIFGVLTTNLVLPKIMNSNLFINSIQTLLSENFDLNIKVEDICLALNKDLSLSLKVNKIEGKNQGKLILQINKADYKLKNIICSKNILNIGSIYFDFGNYKPNISNKNSENKNSLKVSELPQMNISKIQIDFRDNSNMFFRNFHSEKKEKIVYCVFVGYLFSKNAEEPIIIGEDGYLYFSDSINFEDFTLRYKKDKLNLTGTINNMNYDGSDLLVEDLENFFKFFSQKRSSL